MYNFKLLGLVLSFMIGITPVSFNNDYDGTEITFPFNRTDSVAYTVSYSIDDLGTTTPINDKHTYVISYSIDFYCSSACTYGGSTSQSIKGYNIASNHIHANYNHLKGEMGSYPLLESLVASGIPASGSVTHTGTYADENSVSSFSIPVLLMENNTVSFIINFPALTEGMLIDDMLFTLDDFKLDYELVNKRRLIYQLVLDKDVDAEYQRRVLQLLNQNDVDGAYNLVNNYYNTYSVTDTQEKETTINNYNTKENTLNNYYNTENNFTNQVETDFNNQTQQLPDVQESIEDLQGTQFLQSANWVTRQFNQLTVGNALGKILTFSLFAGFILALIGRFKR